MDRHEAFRYEYAPGVIRYGTGAVAGIGDELARQGYQRALLVTGSSVAENRETIDPVVDGIGERLTGTFDETTPGKQLSTSIEGLRKARRLDADVVVAVGGGSTLDVTKGMSVLSSRQDSMEEAAEELAETGGISMGDRTPMPFFAVPTTLAGADLSIIAGISVSASSGLVDEDAGGGLGHRDLMPKAIFHDPAVIATTPRSVLAGSAMNGFNKGLETIYSRHATPITDATAARGLRRMSAGLRELGEDEPTVSVLEPVVEGLLLVQYGIARPDVTTLSLIHAFGHTLRDGFEIQQGTAHAVITPAALRYLFDHVDARRDLLAEAFGVADAAEAGDMSPDEKADAVVDAVAEVRDGLGLPRRLRDLPGADRSLLPEIAEATIEDKVMVNAPEGLEPTADEIERLLESAW